MRLLLVVLPDHGDFDRRAEARARYSGWNLDGRARLGAHGHQRRVDAHRPARRPPRPIRAPWSRSGRQTSPACRLQTNRPVDHHPLVLRIDPGVDVGEQPLHARRGSAAERLGFGRRLGVIAAAALARRRSPSRRDRHAGQATPGAETSATQRIAALRACCRCVHVRRASARQGVHNGARLLRSQRHRESRRRFARRRGKPNRPLLAKIAASRKRSNAAAKDGMRVNSSLSTEVLDSDRDLLFGHRRRCGTVRRPERCATTTARPTTTTGWRRWVKHLARRRKPQPLAKQFVGRRSPLTWAWPDELAGRSAAIRTARWLWLLERPAGETARPPTALDRRGRGLARSHQRPTIAALTGALRSAGLGLRTAAAGRLAAGTALVAAARPAGGDRRRGRRHRPRSSAAGQSTVGRRTAVGAWPINFPSSSPATIWPPPAARRWRAASPSCSMAKACRKAGGCAIFRPLLACWTRARTVGAAANLGLAKPKTQFAHAVVEVDSPVAGRWPASPFQRHGRRLVPQIAQASPAPGRFRPARAARPQAAAAGRPTAKAAARPDSRPPSMANGPNWPCCSPAGSAADPN